jgi:hypothetical protein
MPTWGKLSLILLLTGCAYAVRWPPTMWPPSDLPQPLTSTDRPSLLQTLIPLMRTSSEGPKEENLTWIAEMPEKFYEDMVDPSVLKACKEAGVGHYCMIDLKNCMSIRYGSDEQFIIWDPAMCKQQLSAKLCADGGACTQILPVSPQ